MDLPRRVKTQFAQNRMTAAARHANTVDDARRKQSEEDRQINERFQTNLALFSGGTIALSVTFLGYLKTIPKPIHHESCLIASWICLLICVALSLFSNLFNTNYSFYFMEGEYFEALKVRFETEIKEAPNITDVMNPQTIEEFDDFTDSRRRLVSKSEGAMKRTKWRERTYWYFYLWSTRLSWAGFLFGLILLATFAISNV